MSDSHSPLSSPPHQSISPLTAPPSSTASRRLPPPCWSHDETIALIDSYREKWYSLRRGNLRASHWQEVADNVAARCPLAAGNPQKTSVQCRHKMEKLRKRYRAEIQRAVTTPKGHRYCSSWVHFKRMDSMEKGFSPDEDPVNALPLDRNDEEEEEEEEEENQEDLYTRGVKMGVEIPLNQRFYGSTSNGSGAKPAGANGFRIKIPGRVVPPPMAKMYSQFDEYPKSNPYYGSVKSSRDGYMKKTGTERSGGRSGGGGVKRREGNPVDELVVAIKALGDGYVRMERMKMEMAREVEAMRMDMEMKRTEMILESQQRIVEAFSQALLENKNKKVKRMPTPES